MMRAVKAQDGLGLVELMIAITLGLFLISGAIGVLVSTKTSYNLNKELTWLQDNARFATRMLTREMRMAGFYGCASRQGFTSTLNPAPSGSGWYVNFDDALNGWDGDAAAYPTPEFPAAYATAGIATLPASDLVTLHRAGDTDIEVVDNDPPTSVTIDVVGFHPFRNGDILIITDCQQTTVFQFTGNNPNRVVHNTGTGSPGNCTRFLGNLECSNDTANRRIFRGDEGAFIVQMQSTAYYVTEAANGVPTLYRRSALGNGGGSSSFADEELVQGVENLQLSYGYDTDGDGVANRYVDADEVGAGNWVNVVSVRLHLLFRSFAQVASEPQTFRFFGADHTPDDRFMRQEYIATVELRNKG